MIQNDGTQNKKPGFSSTFAGRFATIGFFFSALLFLIGFFVGTRSMDAEALLYSIKQVFLPALIIGLIAFNIGRIFDNSKKRKKFKKPGFGKLKY